LECVCFVIALLQQRCEGSSSGSEHGSVGGTDGTSPRMVSSPVNDRVDGSAGKIPHTAMAALIPGRLYMVPGMASTPKDDHQGQVTYWCTPICFRASKKKQEYIRVFVY